MFVLSAAFAIAEERASTSAIVESSLSRTAATSAFLPTEKALAVFLRRGVNTLNA